MAARDVVQVFCKGNDKLNMAIRDGKVVLASANDGDEAQLWYKDYRFTGNVTDDENQRPFALVNKKTGQALMNNAVKLAPYDDGKSLKVSMLWTEGKDLGDGFCEVRAVRDIQKTLNGLHGNVKDGTEVGGSKDLEQSRRVF